MPTLVVDTLKPKGVGGFPVVEGCAELLAKGIKTTYEEVLADMIARDRADSTRSIAPAVAAPDAISFDNSGLSPEECTERLAALVEQTLAKKRA